MRGEFLCARGEEELVVGSAKDAAGVGVDIEVNDFEVDCAADGDEGVELDAGRAFKGGEHSVGVGVIEGNYIVVLLVEELCFWWSMMKEPSGAGLSWVVVREKLSARWWVVARNF